MPRLWKRDARIDAPIQRHLGSGLEASYRKLIENEEHFRKITREFFERAGIEYLDSLTALREQLVAGNQPFFVSEDGHLNKSGQHAIAKLVAAHLKSQKTSLREGAAALSLSDR